MSQPQAVGYSPDGTLIAVGGKCGVQLYTASTMLPSKGLATPADQEISALAFSPDGKSLLVCDVNGHLQLWDVASEQLKTTFPTTVDQVNSAVFSPDGSTVAVGGVKGSQGIVELWSVSGNYLLRSMSSAGTKVNSVAYSGDGKKIADGGQTDVAGVVEIWNAMSGSQIASLATTAIAVKGIAFAPNGKTLAVGGGGLTSASSLESVVELWDLTSNSLAHASPQSNSAIGCLTFSPDGSILAVGGGSYLQNGNWAGWVHTFDPVIGTYLATTPNLTAVSAIAFAPDSQHFVCTCDDYGGFAILPSGAIFSFPALGLTHPLSAATSGSSTSFPVFSPDGKSVLGGGSSPSFGFENVWDALTGRWIGGFGTSGGNARSAVYSPDGKTIAISFIRGIYAPSTVQFWDAATLSSLRTMLVGVSDVECISYSPDGTKLAVGGYSASLNGMVEIWDLATGSRIWNLNTSSNQGIYFLAFSPDGSTLADCGTSYDTSGSTYSVLEWWDLQSGNLIEAPKSSATYLWWLAFSPDGKSLTTAGYNTTDAIAEVWGVSDGRLKSTLPMASDSIGANAVAYSPDGKVIYVASNSYAGIQAFDATQYNLLGYFANPAWTLSVSPDGTHVVYENVTGGVSASTIPPLLSYRIASLTLNPPSVLVGSSSTGTVSLAQPAPAGGVTIGIAAAGQFRVTAPQTVFIPEGSTSAAFTIGTTWLDSQTQVVITASSGPYRQSAPLSVTPGLLQSLLAYPTSVVGGTSATIGVTLTAPAGHTESMVALTCSDPAVRIPSFVDVWSNQTTGSFTVTTYAVASKRVATVVASLFGSTQTFSLTITPTPVKQIAVDPSPIMGGSGAKGVVTLAASAGRDGVVVSLSSTSPLISVPDHATIRPGMAQADFTIQTTPVSTSISVPLTATVGPNSKTVTVILSPVQLAAFTFKPSTASGGSTVIGTVTLSGPARVGGTAVLLRCSSPDVYFPSKVVVPAGQSSTTFQVHTKPVKYSSWANFTATYGTVTKTASIVVKAP